MYSYEYIDNTMSIIAITRVWAGNRDFSQEAFS